MSNKQLTILIVAVAVIVGGGFFGHAAYSKAYPGGRHLERAYSWCEGEGAGYVVGFNRWSPDRRSMCEAMYLVMNL